jgi:outer membrane protein insertion porin family
MHGTAGAGQARKATARNILRPALMSILLSTAMVSAPFFTPAYAETYSFSQLVVEGNERVDATTILSYAGIAKGESITSGALNDAYQRIVDAGLFETVELIPQGGTLLIRVQEYPMLNVVDFQGNKALKDENLAEVVKSRSRLVYSPAQAEADATSISEIYRVQGRLAASVTPRIIRRDDNRVDLVFEIAEGKVVEVERLSFVGNRAFSDRRLRQVLETKQAGFLRQLIKGDTFVAERLEVDKQMLRDFYLSRGYVDVQVLDASGELARERDASFVAFTIREGQQFKLGKISTVSELEGVDVAEFVDVQKLRSGVVYSPAIIENNIARMESLALRKGLNFVQIEPRITRNERDQTLDIEFVLKRGEKIFVERIDVEGNTTTLDQVVRRQFRTVEGDPFNPREIRQSAERIRALGFFADAKVESQPGSDGDQVVVKVDVEEQPTGSLSFGASYGLSSGVGLNIGFSESNFLGRGQGLSLNITSGTDSNEGSLTFVEPAFLGRDLKLKFSGYYRETTQASASYDTSNILVSPALDFPVSANSRLEVRLKYFQDTMTNYTGESDLLLGEATGSMAGAGIGYTYSYDTRVNGMNPNGGILLRFGQDFVGLGGDIKYLSTSALALAETKIFNEEVTVRTVFEGGMLNSFDGYQTRVTDRFFGNGKVRGFETNGYGPMDGNPLSPEAVGGNVFAVAKFEADFPLGLPEEYGINGGVFFDIGSVWGLDNTDGTGPDPIDDSFKLRSAVGFSVFWKTPIGPLRFNFSKALLKEVDDKEQTFDLTISTKF